MQKLLVTGATGFIGTYVMAALTGSNYEIHAVSSKGGKKSKEIFWHQYDLHSNDGQRELFDRVKPDLLLHMAWYTEHGQFWTSARNLDWVSTSLNLFRNFSAHGGRRAMALGTCAEYDWRSGVCSEDTTPLKPDSLYGTCKKALFEILEVYCRQVNLEFAWGRVFFPYGPGEPREKFITSIVTNLLRGKEAPCSDGEQVRDFIYVKDLAAAIVALLRSDMTGAVNLGSGTPQQLKEIAATAGVALGQPDLIRLGALPRRENEPPLIAADMKKFRSRIHWEPLYNIERGVAEMADYWQQHES